MRTPPNHSIPEYSERIGNNTLFHYTSADGLIGILQSKQIWSTAFYTTNDESELITGEGILTQELFNETQKLIKKSSSLVKIFQHGGADIREHVDGFEELIISLIFSDASKSLRCS